MLTRREFSKLCLGIGALGLAGWLCGCNPKHERLGNVDVSDAAIGVVRTRYDSKRTKVYYLTGDLEPIGSVRIDHANVGSSEADTCIAGSNVVLPMDTSKSVPEQTMLLMLDVTTQELTSWKADSPWYAAANDTRVFAGSSAVGAAFTAFDREGKAMASYEKPDEFNEALLWYEGSLWAADVSLSENEITLYEFSDDLTILGSATLGLPADADGSVAGIHVNNMTGFDGCLYLSTAAESELGMGVPWGRVCRFDIATGEYGWLTLAEDYTQTVRFADDRMVVLHSDPFDGVPRVCTYDKEGQLLARSEALDNRPLQMVVVGGVVYVADSDEVWALDLDTLAVLNSVVVDEQGECANNTGLFTMP